MASAQALEQSNRQERYFSCQICLEECDSNLLVESICGKNCRAQVCVHCVAEYLRVRSDEALYGIMSKLLCPICLVPVNMLRWRHRLSRYLNQEEDPSLSLPALNLNESLTIFSTKVTKACEMKCPYCHVNVIQLPTAANSVEKFKMPSTLVARIPALRRRVRDYCNHKSSVTELIDYVTQEFNGYGIVEKLLCLIHDPERQATLFLRLAKANPFIMTTCCNAPVCFTCQTAGHHTDKSCAESLASLRSSNVISKYEDIVFCPNCAIQLVKGDGCSWVSCFCNYSFDWNEAVLASKLHQLQEHHCIALRRLFVRLRQQAMLTRFRLKVLSDLKLQVLTQRQKSNLLLLTDKRKALLRPRIARFAQVIRLKILLHEELNAALLSMNAKLQWRQYWLDHPEELHEIEEEASELRFADLFDD